MSHIDDDQQLQAARVVLASMGVSPTALMAADVPGQVVPSFADYVPVVAGAVSEGARRSYGPYWKRIVAVWGNRGLDEPTASEIKQLAEWVRAQVVPRRNGRGGRSAVEHTIAALRCVYNHAVADGLVAEADDPARRVPKPRRLPSTRRGLPDERLAEINHVAATTGNDPALDALLLRLHVETACRRGGALALRPVDLDAEQCLVRLREKGGTVRWQPVSPTLMQHLQAHGTARGAGAREQLLRYVSGKPITVRRYDHLWARVGTHLPWVTTQQVSTHWLRHTTLTWVERHYGYAVARAYAGHSYSGGESGATSTYIRASIEEVATALAALTGEQHPLAAS